MARLPLCVTVIVEDASGIEVARESVISDFDNGDKLMYPGEFYYLHHQKIADDIVADLGRLIPRLDAKVKAALKGTK